MNLHKLILSAACLLLIHGLNAQEQASNVSIHFAFDKYDINATDLAALKSFKQTHPNIESVIIDGYADPVGTDEYNYALSLRRCNAVKQVLDYDENKTEVVFKVTAHGEKGLLYQTDPENRVAIVAVNQAKKPVVQQEVKAQEPVAVTPQPVQVVQEAPKIVAEVKEQPVPEKDTVAAVSSVPKEFGDDETGLIKQLQNSKVGESVVLSDIRFEQASHVLLKSSKPALNAMLDALKTLPALQMEIQGHMCCDDPLTVDGFDIDTKEFSLSYNRAKTVYDFMVQNGIDASRLTYKSFGARKRLVNPEVTDEDRSKNRRVEFLITKK
jgi:outer membrane protein OmpA-like peptidoglycan-associated protein